MTRQINEDIAAYKSDFFKGLSLREFLYGAGALAAGVSVILFLIFWLHMKVNLAIVIGVPVIGGIGLCGFYTKNGMTLLQILRQKRKNKRMGTLTYQILRRQTVEKEPEATGIIEKFLIRMEEKRNESGN